MKLPYCDSAGQEIKADMYLRFPDGSCEKVYATQDADGEPDLGINASNEEFLRRHGTTREFYPLSNFDLSSVTICDPTEEMTSGIAGMSL